MVDFLNPAASSFSSQFEESISPSFSISIRNAFALTSLSLGLPIFGARDWNASSAVISISEIKSTPFSDTSNRMAEPVGARLDFTCTKYLSAGTSLFGVRVIARIDSRLIGLYVYLLPQLCSLVSFASERSPKVPAI